MVIPILLKSKDQPCIVKKQINFTQIHMEQKKVIYQSVEKQADTRKLQKDPGMGVGGILVLSAIGSLFLIYGFLKFENQIILFISILTVLLESAFLTTIYMVIKKHCIDAAIKGILLFNVLATIFSPFLLYMMKNPFMGQSVHKSEVLDTINNKGIFSLLSDANAFGFLLYQTMGILFLLCFLIFTMFGTVHILAMLNLALESRLKRVWQWFYMKTLKFCNSAKAYISIGGLLLVISFLFESGILTGLLNLI